MEELRGVIFCNKYEIIAKNYDKEKIKKIQLNNRDSLWYFDNRLHKFPEDEVLYSDTNSFIFLDGHVDNKNEFLSKLDNDWRMVSRDMIKRGELGKLRGGFCGALLDSDGYCFFVDQVGNRSLYYYCKDDVVIISTKLFFLIETLKKSPIRINVDEMALRYILSLGFMPDDSTVCAEIKRVCSGDMVKIRNNVVQVIPYYRADNTSVQAKMSISDAIEGLDFYFCQAIRREYEKDREYAYRHLVDLSGGLDSRMSSVVAHELGYTDQINIAYCQKNYLDFDIAQALSCDMKHKFIFMPLDDFKWFKDIEENTSMLNAAVPYAGATGAHHILEIIKGCNCGIEHTGMVGDSIVGTFYKSEEENFSIPSGKENAYSLRLPYKVPDQVLRKYKNKELFSIYTRGLLCAQSSYMLRQNYFETSSPFLDVDLLNFILSVPFKYRVNHKLYLAWIAEKHPFAMKYGWEKWHGAMPTERGRLIEKKIYQLRYNFLVGLSRIAPQKLHVGMTPVDYWFRNNTEIAEEVAKYYFNSKKIVHSVLSKELCRDLDDMYENGSLGEKEQALTVCAAVRMIFE